MKSDDTSIYDDPSTSAHVRDLLQAGRRANLDYADYDVERGLAKHLAAIAGTGPVQWAPSAAAAAAAKSTLPVWFGYVAMPLAAASVASLLWLYSADRADRPAPSSVPSNGVAASASAPSVASGVPSAADPERAQANDAADSDSDNRAGDDSHQSSGTEHRRGARSNAAHNARGARSAGTRSSDIDLNAVGSASEGSASDSKSGDVGSGRVANSPNTETTAAPEARAAATTTSAATRATAAPQREAADVPSEAARPTANAPAPAPVVDESRLEREMQMLAVTQRVLSSDPTRALRLAEQGEREFAGSMFSAERRQLGLLALVKLGRLDEARRAGRPFLARYPKAPWSERLRRALATGVVD